jgi:hypothetical protein
MLRRTTRHGFQIPSFTLPAALAILLLLPTRASAAEITASPPTASIGIGGEAVIDVDLALAGEEVASIVEAGFEMTGYESVADVALTPGGPTWPPSGTFGGIFSNVALVQLDADSENAGGVRRVAELVVSGLASGVFELRLAEGATVRAFTPADPFYTEVPLDTATGTLIATVTVPEPRVGAAASLVALVALSRSRRRPALRRSPRSRRPACADS